ncbi:MAG: RNA polymerase sigma factor [Vicinamibacterales bacterium]
MFEKVAGTFPGKVPATFYVFRHFPTGHDVDQSTDCVTGTEPSAATDLDLVRLAQAGDIDAFGELVERNRRAVFRAALACVRSPAEADDVTQEAFVTAYRKLGTFRGDAQFRTWLLSITWRKAIDRRKSISRWLRLAVTPSRTEAREDSFDHMERVAASNRSQEDTFVDEELQQNVMRLIKTLPAKLRDALLLAGTGEHTYEEISHILGAPLGTVKWRVSEARRVLKKKLAALGYAYE